MHLAFVRPWKSITEPLTFDELPQFVILTGPNGAGKSQILNAIEGGALQVDGIPQEGMQGQGQVRIFRLSELMAQVEPPQAMSSYRERWAQVAQHIQYMVEANQLQAHSNPAGLDQILVDNLRTNKMLSEGALTDLLAYSGKYLHQYSTEEIRDALPLLHVEVDPFRLSIAEVFATYFLRRDSNVYQQYKAANGLAHAPFVSDVDFVTKYGSPPWEVLNETLLAIGLNYAFDPPLEVSESIPFSPTLRHRSEEIELRVEDLSAGERTLLAVALSLYTGSNRESAYLQLPRVLLLDEPDASLHPSMVLSLLNVLQDVFVDRHDVKVLMTTHSPTTVALAPEKSLHAMRRGSGQRLSKVSKDNAIAGLAVGIPTLSVKVENRRTVVVEERDDAQVYELFYRILQSTLVGTYSLQFISSGSGSAQHPENAGSSVEVRRLVKEFRAAGNDSIFGIVDRDQGYSSSGAIHVSEERYSIENYALDPLLIGAFLLMHNFIAASELGLPEGVRHFELDGAHATSIAVSIAAMMGYDTADVRSVVYEGGFSVQLPSAFLDTQGHELESAYKLRFPQLNRHQKLMRSILEQAGRDVPQYVPSAVRVLFEQLV